MTASPAPGFDPKPFLDQLHQWGLTVVPPAQAGTADLLPRVQDAVARLSASAREGIPADFASIDSDARFSGPGGKQLFFLLGEDPVFEELVLHPVVGTLVRALLPDAIVSSVTATLKGPGRVPMPLHADQPIHPVGPALVCNVTLLLSDYDREGGALCFVPGSHRALRQPTLVENFHVPGMGQAELFEVLAGGEDPGVVEPARAWPVEAPAGSLVCWHGNTWHGAFARRSPGLRASVSLYWCSKWLRPQEAYREQLPADVLARGGVALAHVIGCDVVYGWGRDGPVTAPFERAREADGAAPDTRSCHRSAHS